MQNQKTVLHAPAFKRKAALLVLNGGVRPAVLAKKLRLPVQKIRVWKQKFKAKAALRRWPAKMVKKRLRRLQAVRQRVMAKAGQLRHAPGHKGKVAGQHAGNAPGPGFKRRVAALAIRGKVPPAVLAKRLRLPVKKIQFWKHQFKDKIPARRWPAKIAQKRFQILRPAGQRPMGWLESRQLRNRPRAVGGRHR